MARREQEEVRFEERELRNFLNNAYLGYVREVDNDSQESAVAAGIVLLKQARSLELTREERVLALLLAAYEEAFPFEGDK